MRSIVLSLALASACCAADGGLVRAEKPEHATLCGWIRTPELWESSDPPWFELDESLHWSGKRVGTLGYATRAVQWRLHDLRASRVLVTGVVVRYGGKQWILYVTDPEHVREAPEVPQPINPQ